MGTVDDAHGAQHTRDAHAGSITHTRARHAARIRVDVEDGKAILKGRVKDNACLARAITASSSVQFLDEVESHLRVGK